MECRRAERLLRSVSTSSMASARTYELTLARAYLDKAREEASEAHYGSAIELATASRQALQVARAPAATAAPNARVLEGTTGRRHDDGAKGRD